MLDDLKKNTYVYPSITFNDMYEVSYMYVSANYVCCTTRGIIIKSEELLGGQKKSQS